jgi:hypothetical protein
MWAERDHELRFNVAIIQQKGVAVDPL